MISFIFNEVLYRPLFNILVFLYQTVSFYDFGIAIIILTILIRVLLYPLAQKSIKSQKDMSSVQSDVKKIQEQYKNNKEEQMKKIMALYKEKGVSPFSGCLPILIQLPFLLALYWVFMAGFDDENLKNLLYGFISNPGSINHIFIGFIDISKKGNIILALLAGAFQFYQSKMMLDQQKKTRPAPVKSATPDFSTAMTQQMTYIMPVMTVFISYSLSAGLALYWITTTIFSIIQQWIVFSKKTNDFKKADRA